MEVDIHACLGDSEDAICDLADEALTALIPWFREQLQGREVTDHNSCPRGGC